MRNITQIQFFLKVAELKSITQAARALYVTPAAVSKQIKQIEQSIGQKVFIRQQNAVVMSDFGYSIYERCKRFSNEFAHLNDFIDSSAGIPHGLLRILLSTDFPEQQKFLNQIQQFHQLFPHIAFDIRLSHTLENINADDFDIILGFSWPPNSSIVWVEQHLLKIQHILCASPAYLHYFGKVKSVSQLKDVDMIGYSIHALQDKIALQNGDFIDCNKSYLKFDNYESALIACVEGAGVLLATDALAAPYLQSGELMRLLPKQPLLKNDLFLFYRETDYELPKIKSFIDYFDDVLAH